MFVGTRTASSLRHSFFTMTSTTSGGRTILCNAMSPSKDFPNNHQLSGTNVVDLQLTLAYEANFIPFISHMLPFVLIIDGGAKGYSTISFCCKGLKILSLRSNSYLNLTSFVISFNCCKTSWMVPQRNYEYFDIV